MAESPDRGVALIVGVRSAIGRACARRLCDYGYEVYGTSRNPTTLEGQNEGFRPLKMDVNDDDAVKEAIHWVVEEARRLDVVVNNAGFGYGGAVEDTSVEEAKELFETNFFGVLRVCRAVLPTMRAQGRGLIVNVSSIGGLMGLPYQGLYCASKFAVEGLTESLRMEVAAFGIDVVLLEPGDIATSFTDHRRHVAASQTHATYQQQYATTLAQIEEDERHGAPPDVVARTLLRIVRQRRRRPRYLTGPFYEKVAVRLKYLLPDRLFEQVLMKNYGL
jgi:NAD(P)-dependent dehydrogenase (short-subunit alcohol dehydrogenase family)